ncbi:MAG TPA: GAF domain-containing protein, partial [Chloroflexota bacterium]|nr:GAF domain-containing protein [Chloroflexota bacterium]
MESNEKPTLPGDLVLLVADLGRLFVESLDLDQVLSRVSERTATVLGDGCGIFLNPVDAQDDNRLTMVCVHHRDPEQIPGIRQLLEDLPFRVGEGLAGHVADTGEPLLLPDAQAVALPEPSRSRVRRLNVRSAIIVPLRTARGVLGILVTIINQSDRHYTATDLTLSSAIADRAAIAIENARLYADTQARAAQLEATLNSIADGVAVVDARGRVVDLNPAWLEHMGLPSKEEGLVPLDLYPDLVRARRLDGADVPANDFAIARALRGDIVKNAEIELQYRDGREIRVSTTAAPVRDIGGRVTGAVAVSRDITADRDRALQLERANAELRELNRLKSDFLS